MSTVKTLSSIRTRITRDYNGNRNITATYYDSTGQRYSARNQVEDSGELLSIEMRNTAKRLHAKLSQPYGPLCNTTLSHVGAEWNEKEYFWTMEYSA